MTILAMRTFLKLNSDPAPQWVSSVKATPAKRLLIVQYAGDYREAYYRLSENNGAETYYAQRYSVNLLSDYRQWCDEVGTLVFYTDAEYDEMLPNGVRAIGAGFAGSLDDKRLLKIVSEFRPTHLVIRTPHIPTLRWAVRNRVRCLLMLADSFQTSSPKQIISNYLLSQLLNHSCIEWIGNHGINSSLSLQKIGINPDKIVPWDWPIALTPAAFTPKLQVSNPGQVNLFFAGSVNEDKGVGDVLRALPLLKQQGIRVLFKIAGQGEIARFEAEARQLGVEENVEFLGLVPHGSIINLMREADAVLVPSRHRYAEGLPMTIYEALCSRTPIVASDHPMFKGKLHHEESALIFPERAPDAIAHCITRLCRDSQMYHRLSIASAEAWQKLQISAKWGDVVEHWLLDSPGDRRWLFEHRLSSAADAQLLTLS